jgi:L-ascorbate metabolism protein UlaG (beta-lactamase superfamily)
MRITKFPQSCLKIEKDGRAILVDPGTLATGKFSLSDFRKFDAVLYTHSHADHLDLAVVDEVVATGAALYGNQNVAEVIGGDRVKVIEDGQELEIAGFQVKAYHMEHCLMVDGTKGVQNTGYVLDGVLLLPGDSTEKVPGLQIEHIALPIFGPDISYHDAFQMAADYQAKVVFPVHFDVVGIDGSTFEYFVQHVGEKPADFKVEVVPNGQSIEI